MFKIITFDNCQAIAPKCIMEIKHGGLLPKGGGIWIIVNEIKPADLYLYLYAKFGSPNGLQNLLRKNDSDNLIHWDWTLACSEGMICILGLNLRTEIHFIGNWDLDHCEKEQLISYIKQDFQNYGEKMSVIRKEILQDWDMFINPYKQIKEAIDQLKIDLDSLDLDPENEAIANPKGADSFNTFADDFSKMMVKYNRAVGYSMALKVMIPILAESFINFLIFVLCRPDIKNNARLFDTFVRSNIDVRVQSLHINCIGFIQPVDWKHDACQKYNSIVNGRNDLLHGNIALNKLKFSEIFFNDKVPVFKKYETMWQQSIGVSINASGLKDVNDELLIVSTFIDYIYSCLDNKIKEQVQLMSEKRDLGLNKKNGILGILLPDHLADFGVVIHTID
ncbi:MULTISPECIES: hypothetical protein [unclassified Sulfuricurvum]|uniref:hypothetical protein n=1 Tax=unclassified Sulfuricurvum TaxID=2632390 RepID=UPI0002998CD3|nr:MULTISPECIES: hypothetical protein [unclassified Sulfuricurvum]AFV98421.1 hypothetical protein B649_10550 [Candidatus Sulfuricurvum sp. RIFRC-1]HBM36615.1 hypothetical protein [Sulfuricurvum sp.]